MSHYSRLALLLPFAALVACEARPTRPLDGVAPEAIRSIAVRGHDGEAGQIANLDDIRTFLGALQEAEPVKNAKVAPEFELLVQPRDGPSLTLQMNRTQISPDVPASAVTWRWRFRDDTAYRLVRSTLAKP